MEFVDTHQHVIYRDKFGYAWAHDIPELASGNFTFEDYDVLTEGAGICGTIFMEADVDERDYKAEARFVGARVGTGGLLGQIAACRPENDRGFDDWLGEAPGLGVVGFRRVLHVVPDDLSQSEGFRANIRKIGDAGLTFDMCFLARQLPIAFELAKACDTQNLVLDHCGVPDIASGAFETWAKDISRIAELENVFIKLSGITAYCALGKHDTGTLRPWVDHVLEAFGPDRMVWGGDWPVVNLGSGLPKWIEMTRALIADLSEDEKTAISRGNAGRIYKV